MKHKLSFLVDQVFPGFFGDVQRVQSSEANYAALLYHHLMINRYLPTQVCTEMYTANLLKDGIRPDLVIFDEEIEGRFNYFKDCDRSQSNTPVKQAHLRCVIEIKGGSQQTESGLAKYFKHDPLCKDLQSDPDKRKKTQNCALAIDIEKLAMWAEVFGTVETGRDHIFLALDMKNPKGPWPKHIRDAFGHYCAEHKVNMIYFAQGEDAFWHYAPGRKPKTIGVGRRQKASV